MKSLDELRAVGGFVAHEPVAREIKFNIGENEYTATIHVLQQSIGDQERMYAALKHETDNEPRNTAVILSTLVRFGETGEDHISVDEANALHPGLARAMLDAIREVNGQLIKN